ncbi:hypothetical protein ABVT39_015949 [Epinephelus coioides]
MAEDVRGQIVQKAGNLAHFPSLKEVGLMEADTPKYLDILSNLEVEFDCRFKDFEENATAFELFAQPFSVHVDAVSEELQMELLELQSDSDLRSKFRELPLQDFYRCVPAHRYAKIRKHAQMEDHLSEENSDTSSSLSSAAVIDSDDLTSTPPMLTIMLDPQHKHLAFLIPTRRLAAHAKLLQLLAERASSTSADADAAGDQEQVVGEVLHSEAAPQTQISICVPESALIKSSKHFSRLYYYL